MYMRGLEESSMSPRTCPAHAILACPNHALLPWGACGLGAVQQGAVQLLTWTWGARELWTLYIARTSCWLLRRGVDDCTHLKCICLSARAACLLTCPCAADGSNAWLRRRTAVHTVASGHACAHTHSAEPYPQGVWETLHLMPG